MAPRPASSGAVARTAWTSAPNRGPMGRRTSLAASITVTSTSSAPSSAR
jgi:hypothetical protein